MPSQSRAEGRAWVWTCLALLVAVPARAEESVEDLLTVSQDDMLDMGTDITAHSASYREAAGVLTVISRDEILALGLRDLEEVLHQVAGFALAQDVEGVTDVGFRGIWGHEGKVLLMIDGQELDEPLYATMQQGNHYLLRNVDRIEIIRGPGSVIYGGNAELAVINVISRSAKQMGTFDVQLDYGNFTRSQGGLINNYARRTVQGSFGYANEPGNFEFTAALGLGQGNRSPRLVMDFYGDPPYHATQGNENLDPLLLNVGLRWGDLRVRVLFDRYATTDRYPYDTLAASPLPVDFMTVVADAQYTLQLSPTFTLVPRLNVRQHRPWQDTLKTSESYNSGDYYDKQVTRSTANVTGTWQALDSLSLLAGAQTWFDYASESLPPQQYWSGVSKPFNNGKMHIVYEDVAVFAQAIWNSPWVNITGGARYEYHSAYGSFFVPRVALTKVMGDFHFKALAAEAFRAPAIENIHLNPAIKPEHTWAFEVELGYAISKAFYAGINLFDFTMYNPIIYDVTGSTEGYNNYHESGALGLELELRYRGSYGFAGLTYSLATAAGRSDVVAYQVQQTGNMLQGLPMHKVVANGGITLGDHWVFGPSIIVLGPRYGALNTPGVFELTPTLVLGSLAITYKDLVVPHFDVTLGCYNIADQPFTYIQAYNSYYQGFSSGRAPIPGLDREVLLRAAWTLE